MSATSDAAARRTGGAPEVFCVGKVAFPTRAKAQAVATRNSNRPGRTSYKCNHCHQWHLGTDSQHIETKRRNEFQKARHANARLE